MSDKAGIYYSGSAEYLAALEAYEQAPAAQPTRPAGPAVTDWALLQCNTGQVGVLQFINAYRFHGFRAADLDPLKRLNQEALPELDPANYGLTPADLDLEFDTGSLAGPPRDSLRNIQARVRRAYCGTLSAEYMHIRSTEQKRWLQARLESTDELEREFSTERRLWLLKQLTLAETVEKLIHTRFVGQKRFSLEGGESLIPLLNYLAERAAGGGVLEIGLGMAHRGRLNVLHNVLGRSALALFAEEANLASEGSSTGDVKYHLGYARDVETAAGNIRIALAFNPSHLEIVNPAVQGWVRAQQQKRGDHDGGQVMPVLIHGDAAFAGQGVVMEGLAMSATRGFSTGGTLHIIVNNQIGFTTSDPRDTRSSLYCTDVMKMVEAPVLHVNGDDPEAVLKAVRIALDYRMTFRHDIAIDLICYRRLGHNEQDEPMVTQPLMYRTIRDLPSTRALYAQRLEAQSVTGVGESDALIEACRSEIESMPASLERPYTPYVADWRPYRGNDWRIAADTAVPLQRLRELGQRIAHEPAEFTLHPRVIMVMQSRRQMAEGSLPLDWGMAEALAFGSLLTEGHGIRLTGQDSGRGTFFHRHAVLHDQNRERWDAGVYIPLQNVAHEQAHFLVIDSLLSEEAVLSFEYGYASSAPNELAIWEAQFGDFANGAQVVIDQFIAAGEAKWGRLNGLVLYLPHGYEGQGPEHSSARIERYLKLAAEENVQIVQPSLPGQLFHLLRRQIRRPYRKPLICFTPKSLLRHPDSTSSLEDLAQGGFKPMLGEAVAGIEAEKVTRLVFCSGRVYFDLAHARKERGIENAAILRVEQFYPLPDDEIKAELAKYPNATEIVWAQDEPQNQGAWRFMSYHLRQLSGRSVLYAGRPESASPSTGYHSVHKRQLEELLAAALVSG